MVDTDPLRRALAAAITEHGEVGLQVAACRDGEVILEACAGVADPAAGVPVTPETLFPVFSATKAVAATAVHVQVSRGCLDYSTTISRHWPEFAINGKGGATVMDVLAHRVGIPQMPVGTTAAEMCDWDLMVARVGELEPLWPPGTRTGYHAYTFGWIVGELIRRTDPAHRPFAAFLQDEICRPLGITDLWLGIPEEAEGRVATLVDLPPAPPAGGLLARAIPPDLATSQAVFGRPDVRRSCHPAAGGIMNARSLARLYSVLAADGALDSVRLLRPEIAAGLGRLETGDEVDQVLEKVVRKARGFYAYHPNGPDVAALMPSRNPGNFGHPGSGGSTGWADPGLRLGVAVFKNRLLPSALASSGHLLAIRDAVYAAVGG